MLNTKRILYSLKDVAIMPATISEIEHRCECNPYYADNKLPIFTSPMPCVVDANTFSNYDEHGINAILPRTEPIGLRLYNCDKLWCAFSLTEFEKNFIKNKEEHVGCHLYLLIDVANGNMLKLYEMAKEAKEFYGDNLKLMVGNVANPKTFEKFCKIGVDYVRCSVGSGNACFKAGTKIKTDKGYKNIEDININDKVLTHKGTFKNVINVFKKENIKKLLRINGIITTPNHRFYVINKKDKEKVNENNLNQYAYWCSAEEINKDNHLLIKCIS